MAPRFLLLLAVILLLSLSVRSDDDEERQLLTGINSYRAALNLSALQENDNAECLADQIADDLEDQPCSYAATISNVTIDRFPNYQKHLDHCRLNTSTTMGGVVLPVCIPGLPAGLVLSNYTQSQYSRYLNDSRYVGTGISFEDDWIVMVLTTNTPSGSFAKSGGSVLAVGWGVELLLLLVGALLLVI